MKEVSRGVCVCVYSLGPPSSTPHHPPTHPSSSPIKQVKIVGQVVDVDETATTRTYKVDDGTGKSLVSSSS